jgi:hypothetical protein
MLLGGHCSEGVGGPYGGAGRGSGAVGSSRLAVTVITSRRRICPARETSLLEPEAMQEGHPACIWRDLRDRRRRIHVLELHHAEGGGRGHQAEGERDQPTVCPKIVPVSVRAP